MFEGTAKTLIAVVGLVAVVGFYTYQHIETSKSCLDDNKDEKKNKCKKNAATKCCQHGEVLSKGGKCCSSETESESKSPKHAVQAQSDKLSAECDVEKNEVVTTSIEEECVVVEKHVEQDVVEEETLNLALEAEVDVVTESVVDAGLEDAAVELESENMESSGVLVSQEEIADEGVEMENAEKDIEKEEEEVVGGGSVEQPVVMEAKADDSEVVAEPEKQLNEEIVAEEAKDIEFIEEAAVNSPKNNGASNSPQDVDEAKDIELVEETSVNSPEDFDASNSPQTSEEVALEDVVELSSVVSPVIVAEEVLSSNSGSQSVDDLGMSASWDKVPSNPEAIAETAEEKVEEPRVISPKKESKSRSNSPEKSVKMSSSKSKAKKTNRRGGGKKSSGSRQKN